MSVIAVVDPRAPLGAQSRWVLSLAAARHEPITFTFRASSGGEKSAGDAAEPIRQKLLGSIRSAVADTTGFRLVDNGQEQAGAEATDATLPVDLRIVRDPDAAAEVVHLVGELGASLVVVSFGNDAMDDPGAGAFGRTILQRAPCPVVMLRVPAESVNDGGSMLAAVTRSTTSKVALRFASELARATGLELRPVYVEPPIGADAELVGQRVVDEVVRQALGKDATGVQSITVIEKDVARGVARARETVAADLIVIGASGAIALGNQFEGSVARRVMKRMPDVAVAAVRPPLPLGNRLRQILEDSLERFVPQLERESRVELVERVQSNSRWDFDFITLISLSTVIAAIGLIQSSTAVVIGAMLVAPLMTPILGVGLALVQGNAELVRRAFRSMSFGVVTAWFLGWSVGVLDPTFHEPPPEMLIRGWPGILDLLVAFVAGLAAAYASSRPSLLAALPGVAIAAALVPPIATSGLAASIGYGEMAVGAFLLFVTNMVAIVLASALTLWAVGVRNVKGASRWTRIVGNSLITAALGLAIYLSIAPPRTIRVGDVPRACSEALAESLPPELRLATVDARRVAGEVELTVRVAGGTQPDSTLANRLREAASGYFALPVRVRLVADFEIESRPSVPRR